MNGGGGISISDSTYRGRGVDHEWTYLRWSYARSQYRRAEVTEWATGLLVVGWDQEAVRQAYRERKARRAAGDAGIA